MTKLEDLRAAADRPLPRPVVALLVVAVTAASTWSLARMRRERPAEGVVTPLTEPRLSDVSPTAAATLEGVGTVHAIPQDRTHVVLLFGGRTVAVAGTVPGTLRPGDVVEFKGRRTGGSRFGGTYLTGTLAVVRSGAPKLDDLWRKP